MSGFLDRFTARLAAGISGSIEGDVSLWDGHSMRVRGLTFTDADNYLRGIEGLTPSEMWKRQPHLRTVIDFLARQMTQLNLHLYTRDADGEIERVRDGAVAERLRKANEDQTFSELLGVLVTEWALYDDAAIFVLDDGSLRVFPTGWIKPGSGYFRPNEYKVQTPEGGTLTFPADRVIRFRGVTPGDPSQGTSRVDTLRLVLEEQFAALIYRKQVWKRGGRFGGYIFRPKDAPSWDDAARGRFWRMWDALAGNKGGKAGSAPLLEDGMEFRPTGFSAKENEWAEATKLSLQTCAQVYHVNPTMIGLLDNANFSNVREFRRMLYTDTLGPIIAMIEDRLTTFLLPLLDAPANSYVEFNTEAKLRGSFEEQAKVLSASVGAPWMTRNEARALFNRRGIDGGDDIVTPLNVLIGGQSSPVDGVTEGGGGELVEVASAGPTADDLAKLVTSVGTLIRSGFDPQAALAAVGLSPIEHTGLLPVTVREDEAKGISSLSQVQGVIDRFRDRQTRTVHAKRAGGAADWWDRSRWVGELRDDLVETGLTEGEALLLSDRVNDQAFAAFASETVSAQPKGVSA